MRIPCSCCSRYGKDGHRDGCVVDAVEGLFVSLLNGTFTLHRLVFDCLLLVRKLAWPPMILIKDAQWQQQIKLPTQTCMIHAWPPYAFRESAASFATPTAVRRRRNFSIMGGVGEPPQSSCERCCRPGHGSLAGASCLLLFERRRRRFVSR